MSDDLDYENRATAPTTTEFLHLWDQRRPRSRQAEIGMSELGGCERRAGYRLAGTKPTNPSGSMQAILGSAIHEAVASIVIDLDNPEDLTEREVRFAGLLGHFDRYHGKWRLVVDVKTTSSRFLEVIKLNGAEYQHVWQVSLYAAALARNFGAHVERLRIDYIARDTGEEFNWPDLAGMPFDPKYVREALEWLKSVRDTPLEMLPRKYTPDSTFCAHCPFLETCWEGAVPNRDRLSVLYVEDPDAEKWASRLKFVRALIKRLKAKEKRYAGALQALRPDNGGRVQAGRHTLDFRTNGLYFVAGKAPQPAVGYDEEDAT